MTIATLPHLTTDDHAGDFVVTWPNHDGDDFKPAQHFPTIAAAAWEIRFQLYADCSVGGEINLVEIDREFPNRAA
jgi:hypothetical protein